MIANIDPSQPTQAEVAAAGILRAKITLATQIATELASNPNGMTQGRVEPKIFAHFCVQAASEIFDQFLQAQAQDNMVIN